MQISQSNNSLSPLFCSILYQHFLIIRLRTLFTLTSSTTDELCNHNNRPTNRHAWILFFQMPQRFPPGKGNRQQRDARAKGVRGNQKTPRLKQNRPIVDDVRELVSPSTWNTAGSSRVYFCQPKRLPSALSDRQLLCCLTRKEKKERGAEWGGAGLWAFPLLGVLSLGDEAFSEAGMWCSFERRTGGILDCIDLCVRVRFCGKTSKKVLSEESVHSFKMISENLLL